MVVQGDVEIDGENYLDQVPEAEAAFISPDPLSGAIKTYIGGLNFSKSNFDRVKQSFPQAGSSFKPFIYTYAFANGYKASDKINDAPIIFFPALYPNCNALFDIGRIGINFYML